MKRILPLCSFAAVMSLAACGAFREEADKVGDTIELQGRFQTQVKDELSIRANGIGCVVNDFDFSGTSMTLKQYAFADTGCTGNPLGELTTEGSASIGNELPVAPGARELNLTVTKVTVTPRADNWMNILGIDGSGECNIGAVPVNETREVTGMKCGGLGKLPARDAIFFTAFLLNGDELRLTKLPNELPDNVGTKDHPAPRALDLSVVYRRK